MIKPIPVTPLQLALAAYDQLHVRLAIEHCKNRFTGDKKSFISIVAYQGFLYVDRDQPMLFELPPDERRKELAMLEFSQAIDDPRPDHICVSLLGNPERRDLQIDPLIRLHSSWKEDWPEFFTADAFAGVVVKERRRQRLGLDSNETRIGLELALQAIKGGVRAPRRSWQLIEEVYAFIQAVLVLPPRKPTLLQRLGGF